LEIFASRFTLKLIMGLLPPVILGALLIVAFALTSQQRLAIASHTGPMPARQIAYQMLVHHWAAVRLMQSNPASYAQLELVDALYDNDYQFLSCMQGNTVTTVMMTVEPMIPTLMISTAEANLVEQELSRQSVIAPELGRIGQTAWSVGYNNASSTQVTPIVGIGLAQFVPSEVGTIHTIDGDLPLPDGCLMPDGAPVIMTQVLP
jgi:hypothetical protein